MVVLFGTAGLLAFGTLVLAQTRIRQGKRFLAMAESE